MKQITLHKMALAASLILAVSCSKLDDAKEAVADLSKQDAAQQNSPCPTYKQNFIDTQDSSWLNLYQAECANELADANMPQDLNTDCQKEYRNMIALADSLVLALKGTCTEANVETEQICIDTKNTIEMKAKAFQDKCGIDEFYFPTPEEKAIKTQTVNGECAWQAWIPEKTRLEGQDSTVMIQCQEERSECSKVIIRDTARIVETHLTLEGDTVYLPCIQEASEIFAPCDFNKDRFVDPIETQQCQASGDNKIDLCDWNGDKVLDSLERRECAFRGDSASVNPGYYDPCDWNFDGMVDEYEANQCRNAYACTESQTPWWDEVAQKQVCVNNEEIPKCEYPTFPSYVRTNVICMDPCDMNRDGELSADEKNSCTIHQFCGIDSIAFWDPEKQGNVCIANKDIPVCEIPNKQVYRNGEVKCYEPCDGNFDGIIDDFESGSCLTCLSGEVPMWDITTQKNICHEPIPCQEGQHPILRDGVGECINRCDFDQNGTVDELEKIRCGTAVPPDSGTVKPIPATN